jgi:hypothetical protein
MQKHAYTTPQKHAHTTPQKHAQTTPQKHAHTTPQKCVHPNTHIHTVWKFQSCCRNRHIQSSRSVLLNLSDAIFCFQVRSYIIYTCLICEASGSFKGEDEEFSFRVMKPGRPVHRYPCTNVHGGTSCKTRPLYVSQSSVRAVKFCSALSCHLCNLCGCSCCSLYIFRVYYAENTPESSSISNIQEIHHLFQKTITHYHVRENPPLVPNLIQTHPVHPLATRALLYLSRTRSFKWLLPRTLSCQNFLYFLASPTPHLLHTH